MISTSRVLLVLPHYICPHSATDYPFQPPNVPIQLRVYVSTRAEGVIHLQVYVFSEVRYLTRWYSMLVTQEALKVSLMSASLACAHSLGTPYQIMCTELRHHDDLCMSHLIICGLADIISHLYGNSRRQPFFCGTQLASTCGIVLSVLGVIPLRFEQNEFARCHCIFIVSNTLQQCNYLRDFFSRSTNLCHLRRFESLFPTRQHVPGGIWPNLI